MNNTNTSPSLASSLAAGLAVAAKAPAALSQIAPQIAAALPGAWTARPIHPEGGSNENCYLIRADGLTLFFAGSRGGWAAKGRFLLQHSRPRKDGKWVELWENHNTVKAPEITVADTKTAEKIAADIVARLLPEAERVNALALASIARDNSAEAARIDTARAIAGAIGADVECGRDGSPRSSFYHRGVSLTVNTGESVRVELTATRAQALALLAFLDSPAYRGTE